MERRFRPVTPDHSWRRRATRNSGTLPLLHTRTNRFELTPYLRNVNAASAKSHEVNFLARAEPVDPLPEESKLKEQYTAADKKLNEKYQKVLVEADKETVSDLRRSQREWLKARDAGLQIYHPGIILCIMS